METSSKVISLCQRFPAPRADEISRTSNDEVIGDVGDEIADAAS